MFVLIVAIEVVLQQLLLLLWFLSILSSLQLLVVRTSTRTNAANSTITTLILFTSIRFNILAFTSTISTTIMITVTIATISISVAVTITLPSVIVLIHIIMINTIVQIIVTLVSNWIMNVTIITASNNASNIHTGSSTLIIIVAISTGTKQYTIIRLLLSSF